MARAQTSPSARSSIAPTTASPAGVQGAQSMAREPEHIVIIGAGVIGTLTAYYLSRHPAFDASAEGRGDRITVIDAVACAAGASGKAGGLLASDWHGQATASLGKLSFDLHKQLARVHEGDRKWGFRHVKAISVEADMRRRLARRSASGSRTTGAVSGGVSSGVERPNKRAKLPSDVDWIDEDCITRSSTLGTEETMAQVHPRQFCRSILAEARCRGVRFLLGKVEIVERGRVVYTPVDAPELVQEDGPHGQLEDGQAAVTDARPDADTNAVLENVSGEDCGERRVIADATRIVMCAGPWTARLLGGRCGEMPISGQRAHSITLRTPHPVSPHAVFSECRFSDGVRANPEMYARKAEVYVCGEGDDDVPLPDTAAGVQVDASRCAALIRQALDLSPQLQKLADDTGKGTDGIVGVRQACYLPIVTGVTKRGRLNGTFSAASNTAGGGGAGGGSAEEAAVGETSGLKGTLHGTAGGPLVGKLCAGLYVAAGHSCWGIHLAPATGKILSELIWDRDVLLPLQYQHDLDAAHQQLQKKEGAGEDGGKSRKAQPTLLQLQDRFRTSADVRWLDPLNAVDELW